MEKVYSISRFCKRCQIETERNAIGNCRVCQKAATLAWKMANPEKVKAAAASWYVANTDLQKARAEAWHKSHPGSQKAAKAAYNVANRESRRIQGQNRNERKRLSGGVLSKGLSANLLKLQRGKCACCGLALGVNFHLDHIMPIALGGQNIDSNMQLLRSICNLQKHAKHPIDFMQERGFLL